MHFEVRERGNSTRINPIGETVGGTETIENARKWKARSTIGRGGGSGGTGTRGRGHPDANEKRTRIFSSSITIDWSGDAYRDGSSFQRSSRFPFSRYSNPRARSGDIETRKPTRERMGERGMGEGKGGRREQDA